jgi:hypothetical protein
MKQFTITFNLSPSGLQFCSDVSRGLTAAAESISGGDDLTASDYSGPTSGSVQDQDGNPLGSWSLA